MALGKRGEKLVKNKLSHREFIVGFCVYLIFFVVGGREFKKLVSHMLEVGDEY